MKILAIETSCDETAAAVVKTNKNDGLIRVISEAKATSANFYAKTGGIVPEIAARQQSQCIVLVIKTALEEADLTGSEIDSIAVTVGPGLIGSLLIGVETARSLAYALNKALIPVNHVLAHLYANWIEQSSRFKVQNTTNKNGKKLPGFPAVGLVVSGGHTDLVLMKSHQDIEYLGGTRDDAAGECFDKGARLLLGVTYPGGPAIEKSAKKFNDKKSKSSFKLPRPMVGQENFEMSFAGLKTALFRIIDEKRGLSAKQKSEIAYELQEAITDVLLYKTILALEKYCVKSLIIGGGVVANKRLRERLEKIGCKYGIAVFAPDFSWCTDNAAMIGACALHRGKSTPINEIKANPTLEITDRFA